MLFQFRWLLIVFFILFFSANMGFSQARPQYRANDIYKAYEKYSPQDMVSYVKKGIDYFLTVGEKKALIEFDKTYPSEWNNFPLGFQFMVMSCSEQRAVSHTLSEFFPVFKQKDFGKQFKDVNGKKTYIQLCEGVKRYPQGYWVIQKQFWPETQGALSMGAFMMKIPGTSYWGHIFYPTQKYTEEQLNDLIPK